VSGNGGGDTSVGPLVSSVVVGRSSAGVGWTTPLFGLVVVLERGAPSGIGTPVPDPDGAGTPPPSVVPPPPVMMAWSALSPIFPLPSTSRLSLLLDLAQENPMDSTEGVLEEPSPA
jgi:hypothetical protein